MFQDKTHYQRLVFLGVQINFSSRNNFEHKIDISDDLIKNEERIISDGVLGFWGLGFRVEG